MARKYGKKQVRKAILNSKGIMSNIADQLGCAWHTAEFYVNKHNLQVLMCDQNERLIDYTEKKLFGKIKANDTACIIFCLKTRGKKRGWIEKQEIVNTHEREKVVIEKVIITKK